MSAFWRWTRAPFQEIDFGDRRAYDACLLLVRVVYASVFGTLFLAVWEGGMVEWTLDPEEPALWPTSWFDLFAWEDVATLVPVVTWLAALGAVLFPQRILLRALVLAGLLCIKAAHFSHQGKIDHNYHTLFAALFVFLFLPRVVEGSEAEAEQRDAYCRVFWGAQALVLLTYSMAGFSKLLGAAVAIRWGEVSALHPEALPLHIAANWERSQDVLLGRLMATNVPASWASYLASIYFETFALVAAFRPRLHRLWGTALVLFHVGVLLSMGIVFAEASVVLVLLVCLSPFARRAGSAELALAGLPWIGLPLSALWARAFARGRGELHCLVDRASPRGRRREAALAGSGLSPETTVEPLDGALGTELRRELGERFPARAGFLALRRAGAERALLTGTSAYLWARAQAGWHALWAAPLLLVPEPVRDAAARLRGGSR